MSDICGKQAGMDRLMKLTSDQKKLKKFIASRTGELLYDEDTKLWWDGPAAIVEMYKCEINEKD